MADQYLPLVLGAAGLASAVLVAVAVLALAERWSTSHALVAAALGALAVRSVVGIATEVGLFAGHAHHFVEHALDLAVVAMLIAAVGLARRGRAEPTIDHRYGGPDDDY